jgi:DNA polymerase-3 subunit delta
VLAEARAGRLRPAYLFYGPERYLLNLTVNRLCRLLPEEVRSFNYRRVEGGGDQPADGLLAWVRLPPVGAPWRILVVAEEELFTRSRARRRADEEAYLSYLRQPVPTGSVVLVAGEAVEKGRPLYQAIEQVGGVVAFEALDPGGLRRWAMQEAATYGKKLASEALAYLLAVSGGDLGFLLGAVAKTCLYVGEQKEVTLAAAREVVAATPQGNIFHLVDAVGERDPAAALAYLRHLLDAGEPPSRIVYMLSRQIRLILHAKLLAQEPHRPAEIGRRLEVPSFVAEKILRQARKWSAPLLVEALGRLFRVDLELKKSVRDPRAVLEEALLAICRPASTLAGPSN